MDTDSWAHMGLAVKWFHMKEECMFEEFCMCSWCSESFSGCFSTTMKRASSRPHQLKEQLLRAINGQNSVSKSWVIDQSNNYSLLWFCTHAVCASLAVSVQYLYVLALCGEYFEFFNLFWLYYYVFLISFYINVHFANVYVICIP